MKQTIVISIIATILLCANTNNTLATNIEDKDYDNGIELLEAGEYLDALKAFGRSAKNGNSDAQYRIGIMFLEGQGMTPNPVDAAYWFRKAAQNGHAPSQFEIAYCFDKGIGVQPDERIAAEWFWRAAEQGDPDAAFYLAQMYRDGRGMQQNTEKARKYFTIAAEAGLSEARQELELLPPPAKKTASKAKASKKTGKTNSTHSYLKKKK